MIRLEAWTPPGSVDFYKKIETVEVIRVSGTKTFRGQGSGRMVCAEGLADLRLLIDARPGFPATDVATMIRVWDDTTHVHDWLLEPEAADLDEDGLMELGGPDAIAMLSWAYVECSDWNGDAVWKTLDPDWIYGGDNLLDNGGFEDEPMGIANPGFEDGTRDPWWPGAVEGYSAVDAIVDHPPDVVDTGVFAARVQPLLGEGGYSTTVRLLPANFYTVTMRFRGLPFQPYELGAIGPAAIVPVAPNSVLVPWFNPPFIDPDEPPPDPLPEPDWNNPAGYEVQHQFAASGNWETKTLVFGTAGDQNSSQLNIREALPFDGGYFYVDEVFITGPGIGMAPWHPTGENQPGVQEPVSNFQVTDDQFIEGAWSANITAADGHGIQQDIDNGLVGTRYTAQVQVGWADPGGVVALQIFDIRGKLLASSFVTAPTGGWAPIQVTFRTPSFLPGSRQTLRFKVINASGGEMTWLIDDAQLYQGFPPSTAGKILLDQRESMDFRGALPFITYDFTDTVDSLGQMWDTLLSHTVKHGGTDQLQVVEAFESLGYEARLVVDDYQAGTYLLQVYNPDGMGQAFVGGEPSILLGQDVVDGDVTRRHAAYNVVQALGKEGMTTRVADAASQAAISRREKLFYDETLQSDEHASEMLREGLAQGLTSALTVLGNAGPRPFLDFDVADTLDWNLADANGWATQRVGSITYVEDGDEYVRYSLSPDVER